MAAASFSIPRSQLKRSKLEPAFSQFAWKAFHDFEPLPEAKGTPRVEGDYEDASFWVGFANLLLDGFINPMDRVLDDLVAVLYDCAANNLVVAPPPRADPFNVGVIKNASVSVQSQWRNSVAFYRSEKGGSLTLDEAVERATRHVDEERAAEVFERVMTQSAEVTDYRDLHDLWTHSPEDAEFVRGEMKRESRLEFMTGHLAAIVFEPVDWMRTAWKRAKFLSVRDSFLDEYEPEGGVEVALVDTMAQAYFLQLHWTEEAVRRTNADPRRHSYEYEKWEQYKRHAAKAQMWDTGFWKIPYAAEVQLQEQAVRMADHFSRLFQRTVRQLDNHRLAKAKLRRLAAPTVRRSVVGQEREKIKEWRDKLERSRKSKP